MPPTEAPPQTTQLLVRAADESALDAIFPLVYDELRRLAQRQLRNERDGHTLSTTALVHEAYLRLVDQRRAGWCNRAHFLAIAATAMRRILVDHARKHRSEKRGGGAQRVPLDALDDALARLSDFDRRQAKVVECRFFGGMTEEETATALGIGLRTAKRDWAKARSWLYQEIYPDTVA